MQIKKGNDRKPLKILEDGVLPLVLQHSVPRDVVLNGAGWTTAVFAALLAVIGAVGCPLLAMKLERDNARTLALRTAGVRTEAVVTEVRRTRGDEPRVTVRYKYTILGGREVAGRLRLREKDPVAKAANAGVRIPVVYLEDEPERSWLAGREPEEKPVWLAMLPPVVLLPCAVALVFLLHRQKALLSEGRAAVAEVVAANLQAGEHKTWKVTYSWRLPSGAKRKAMLATGAEAVSVGAKFAIVYDAERPERHSQYPVSLVRVRR